MFEVLQVVKMKYVGKFGLVMKEFGSFGKLLFEECKVCGVEINVVCVVIQVVLDEKELVFKCVVFDVKFVSEVIDVMLLGLFLLVGGLYFIFCVFDDLIGIYCQMGYVVIEGLEVEEEYYNFEVFNVLWYYFVCDL